MLWEWTRDSFRMKFLLQTPLHQIFGFITLTEPQKDGTTTSMVPFINLSRNRTAVQGAAPFHTPAPGRESTGQTSQSTMVIYFPAAWRAKCFDKHLSNKGAMAKCTNVKCATQYIFMYYWVVVTQNVRHWHNGWHRKGLASTSHAFIC